MRYLVIADIHANIEALTTVLQAEPRRTSGTGAGWDDVLVLGGYGPPTYAANWYPSVEEFVALYEQAGFKDIDARLIERPTPLEHGVAAWVTTFRAGWLDRAEVPHEERQAIADAVAQRVGSDMADYVRLRFMMRKPN